MFCEEKGGFFPLEGDELFGLKLSDFLGEELGVVLVHEFVFLVAEHQSTG